VRWKCSANPVQTFVMGTATSVADLCNDVDMCNNMCVFTVDYIKVVACNYAGACSPGAEVPEAESPGTCGGGCCL